MPLPLKILSSVLADDTREDDNTRQKTDGGGDDDDTRIIGSRQDWPNQKKTNGAVPSAGWIWVGKRGKPIWRFGFLKLSKKG